MTKTETHTETLKNEGMSSETLVMEGYKKTKLGWIPENWATPVFSEIAKRKKEKLNPKNGVNENFKCIELEHIESETGRLLGYTDSRRYHPEIKAKASLGYRIRIGREEFL